MSPDQLAVAQLYLAQWQLWITGLAIFLGPLAGVLFSLWFQRRKERRDAKLQLFLVLMAERKSTVSDQVSKALNKIDVVFSDSLTVKKLWHEYYQILHEPPGEQRGHKWLELLAAMSLDLGYSKLSQVDLDKFYIPQGHVDAEEFQRKVAQQWSRVLENTERFVLEKKDTEAK